MKHVFPAICLGFAFGAVVLPATAANSYRTALVEEIQVDSHSRVGSEDLAWVKMTGNWSGVSCGADWAWFNAKEDPQILATLLSARAQGLAVRLYVDDTMQKWGATCHVMTVMLMP